MHSEELIDDELRTLDVLRSLKIASLIKTSRFARQMDIVRALGQLDELCFPDDIPDTSFLDTLFADGHRLAHVRLNMRVHVDRLSDEQLQRLPRRLCLRVQPADALARCPAARVIDLAVYNTTTCMADVVAAQLGSRFVALETLLLHGIDMSSAALNIALGCMPHLTNLSIYRAYALGRLAFLRAVPHLRRLLLRRCGNSVPLEDFRFLHDLADLTSVQIDAYVFADPLRREFERLHGRGVEVEET
jgi:hypothetical protein